MTFVNVTFRGQEESFESGELLFEQGDDATDLFIIEEGCVNVSVNFLEPSPDESSVPIPEHLHSTQKTRSDSLTHVALHLANLPLCKSHLRESEEIALSEVQSSHNTLRDAPKEQN